MPGCKYLYIYENNIYKIPKSRNYTYKPMPKLGNKEVLLIYIYYSTLNKKPYEAGVINFDRIKLDSNGAYIYDEESKRKESYNFMNYFFMTPEMLAKEKYLKIPRFPAVPTSKEKKLLLSYIKTKYPSFYKSFSLLLNNTIIAKSNKKIDTYLFHWPLIEIYGASMPSSL